jgi:hypothetical protein
MQKKHGRSRPPRTCLPAVESLEARSLPSVLTSAPERAPSAGLMALPHHGSGKARWAAVRASATVSDRRSEGAVGSTPGGDHAAGPGHTDPSGNGGQQGQAGQTGDNQSGPQQGDSQAGGHSPLPGPVLQSTGENPGAGPAQDQADEAPTPADPSADSGPAVPPTPEAAAVAFLPPAESSGSDVAASNESIVKASAGTGVSAPAAPEGPVGFSTQASVGQRLPPTVPEAEAGAAGTVIQDRGVGPAPQAAGFGLVERAAPRQEGGAGPEPLPPDGLVPRLAGELRETLAVDAAVLERGLRRFLDQLSSLGAPAAPGANPGPLPWLGRVQALLPWLGAAGAAALALELARRRRLPDCAFAAPGERGRWDWVMGFPEPPPDDEP